jgi:hypothetical protein
MSIFSNILEKIGIKKKAEPEEQPASPATKPTTPSSAPAVKKPKPSPANVPSHYAKKAMKDEAQRAEASKVSKPVAVPMVDVVSKLEDLAAKNPAPLDWKVSIVDLLILLEIDSSYSARKELATELGCPAELMDDSAKMNMWLHKKVLEKIAENGGNIPKELLD